VVGILEIVARSHWPKEESCQEPSSNRLVYNRRTNGCRRAAVSVLDRGWFLDRRLLILNVLCQGVHLGPKPVQADKRTGNAEFRHCAVAVCLAVRDCRNRCDGYALFIRFAVVRSNYGFNTLPSVASTARCALATPTLGNRMGALLDSVPRMGTCHWNDRRCSRITGAPGNKTNAAGQARPFDDACSPCNDGLLCWRLLPRGIATVNNRQPDDFYHYRERIPEGKEQRGERERRSGSPKWQACPSPPRYPNRSAKHRVGMPNCKDAAMKELQDVYVQICGCRECGLPAGYCPQLRPPGRRYAPGGVVFVQINPGHTGSLTAREIEGKYVREHDREIARRKATNTQKLVSLQSQFIKTPGDDTYETMRSAFLNSMSEHWGWPPGKYGAMIKAHGVSLDEIAIINLAQCPVPDNSYQRHQLERCWTKWTSQLLTQLQPCVIVAQGRQVWDFLRTRTLPVKATLVEGVHHADRKSNEDKQRRLLRVREAIEQCAGDRRQN